jgi:restriction system protein
LTGRDLTEEVAKESGLSDADRLLTIHNGTPRYFVRIKQARYTLKSEGQVEATQNGSWRLTAAGRKALDSAGELQPKRQGGKRALSPQANVPEEIGLSVETAGAGMAPEERLEQVIGQIHAQLERDLVAQLLGGSPGAFERAVLRLLEAMGYAGIGGIARHLGGSGDGGVDGVIERDPLGLDRIYIQAKRYQGAVQPAAVREFVGALAQQGAGVGVLFTTGSFTKAACAAVATGSGPRVKLVDGKELAKMMIRHGVGVSIADRRVIPRIDLDFFAEE